MKHPYATLDSIPPGVEVVKKYRAGYSLLACHHDESQQQMMSAGGVLDYRGIMRCRFCGGDEHTTDSFSRPVKRIVYLAKGVEPGAAQASLF